MSAKKRIEGKKTTKTKNIKKDDLHPLFRKELTFAQKAADVVTHFAGSWTFIILVFVVLAIWMAINSYFLLFRWDPYPYILLNFVLSAIAALQAPIILMSQNREAERDRLNAKYDYIVNRKAEREVSNMQKDLDEIKKMLLSPKKR